MPLPPAKPRQSMGEFALRMKIRGDHVPINTTDLLRKLALSIDQKIVRRTPVDKGRARANWYVNLMVASIEVNDFEGDRGAATQESLNRAQAVLANVPVLTTTIHITNNLPYIESLNNGSSAQAPQNFVQIAIKDGTRAILGGKVSVAGG